MVRTYKRTTNRGGYGTEALSAAVEAVRNGTPVKAAARMYGIAPRTIRRHRDLNVCNPGMAKLGSKETVFKPEYETLLVTHVQEMEKAMFGLTTVDMRRLAYDLAVHLKINHPFKNKCAGVDWLKGFLRRHPNLSVRSPEATSLSRAVGFNRPQVARFYDVFKEALDKTNADALRVWNMDETGLSNVHKPVNIIATKGARAVGKITSGERGKTVTVICALNAAGTFVPPTFIYPRKRMVQSLMNGAPAGALGLCSASGWTDSDIFLRWLEHFTAFIKCSPETPHILLLDGHHSHKTLEACLYARNKGLIIITFPPHCTHRLQPLDVCFFKSLKSAYNLESGNWMTSNPGRRISVFEVAAIFAVAYNKCAGVQKAVTGFETCGLWPYNPDRFTDDDFAASFLTEEPLPVNVQTLSGYSSPATATPNLVTATTAQVSAPDTARTTTTTGLTGDQTTVTAAVPDMAATAYSQASATTATPDTMTEEALPSDCQTQNVCSTPVTAASSHVTPTAALVSEPDTARTTTTGDSTLVTAAPETATTTDSQVPTSTTETMPEECGRATCATDNSQFTAMLHQLSPKPHITVQRARKRKAESATNITSSPFKQMLQEKAAKTVQKRNKDGKTKNKTTKECTGSSSSGSKSTGKRIKVTNKKKKKTARESTGPKIVKLKKTERCQGCGIMEGGLEDINLQQGWIACLGCGKWYHEVCAEEHGLLDDDYFTCKTCTA